MAPGQRPPWWYFVLALVVVPALWPFATAVLATIFTYGPAGAWLAGFVAAGAGIATLVSVGRARELDRRWVAAAVLAAIVATAAWTTAVVLIFVAVECGADPCFN